MIGVAQSVVEYSTRDPKATKGFPAKSNAREIGRNEKNMSNKITSGARRATLTEPLFCLVRVRAGAIKRLLCESWATTPHTFGHSLCLGGGALF